jgi:hypothetical protein
MGVAADYVSRTKIGAYFHSMRESRKLILFIVAVALLLDNMLLTIVGKARNYTANVLTIKTTGTGNCGVPAGKICTIYGKGL